MSLSRYAAKRDRTEPSILKALAQIGARYLLLNRFDVLVLFRGRLVMFECKTGKGRKTKSQEALVRDGWPLHFVTSPEQAIEILTEHTK